MRKKYLLALAPVVLILQLGSGWAAPDKGGAVKWEGAADRQAAKLWVHNLSAAPAEVTLEAGRAETASIAAHGAVEMQPARLADGAPLRLRSRADLLVLQIPDRFDAGAVEVEGPAAVRSDRSGKLQITRPALAPGTTGSARVTAESSMAQIEVAIELLVPGSSVRIRQLDARGREVGSLVASSSKPVRWRTILGPVDGEAQIELQPLRGKVQGTATAVEPGTKTRTAGSPFQPRADGGGLASFNYEINWPQTPDLRFYVSSGPPSVCGDLWAQRNFGSWTVTPGWICTDANGNASAGPWSWANQSGDEEAYAYIQWSNGLSTNQVHHIWDKTAPTVDITSPPDLPAPTSFYGTANDPNYGAGFSSSWAQCQVWFYDRTTYSYYDPYFGSYSDTYPYNVSCSISGMPSRSVSWSLSPSQLPPGHAHISGHCYQWRAQIYDGGQWGWWDWYFCV